MNQRKSRLLSVLHPLLVLLGIAALACAIAKWPDAFFFSKVVRLPEFAQEFRWLPSALIFLCLAGPALTAPSVPQAGLSVAMVLILSGATALIAIPAPAHSPFANSLFDLAWFAGFHGLIPAIGALLLAGVRTRLVRRSGD